MEKQTVEFNDLFLLIWSGKLNNISEILSILEKVVKTGKPIVIMANEFSDDFITAIAVNKMRACLKVAIVKAPSYGGLSLDYLEDLASIGGGIVLGQNTYMNQKEVDLDCLCNFKKCEITKTKINLIEGLSDTLKVEKRINLIKSELEKFPGDSVLLERLGKLIGGACIIKVGYASSIESNEMRLRIEDAINATRSAMEEGTVIGGGCALFKCKSCLDEIAENLNGDAKTGVLILKRTLEAPLRQIAKNSGIDDGYVICKITENECTDFGFNALTGNFENLRASGVIDPTLVTKSALTNAVSVASTLLTTSCIVL